MSATLKSDPAGNKLIFSIDGVDVSELTPSSFTLNGVELATIETAPSTSVDVVTTNVQRDALTPNEGDVVKVTSTGLTFVYDGSSWLEISSDVPVDSVNGETGAVVLNTDDVSEGTTNKYYDDTLVDTYVSGLGLASLSGANFSGNITIPDDGNLGSTTTTDAMTINSTGDVSFGYDLSVAGNLTISGTTTTINTTNVTAEDAVITLNSGQTTPLNDIGLLFQRYDVANSTDYNVGLAWDESAGKFVIGKTPEDGADNDLTFNTEWLTVNDSGLVSNVDLTVNGSITETSSIALKDNVVPLNSGLEKILQLNPVSYDRKSTGDREFGLVAEDVAGVMPELVSFDGEGNPVGVNYSRLSVLLIQALKELLNGES
mgnify:FL=1